MRISPGSGRISTCRCGRRGRDSSAACGRRWKQIPYGKTRSYGELAAAIGSAPRAVGGACGKNPIPIVIPCHRVLSKAGLGGYSGSGGLKTKETLLALEGALG